jgi:LacI family transcriptional regulator
MNQMSVPPNKPKGIRQIASALGISIGTVDRALHDRAGISKKTRDKVLRMAQKLNYSPNSAARNLKLARNLRLGVFLPERIAVYFDSMRDGIRDAANMLASGNNLEAEFFSFPSLGVGDVECMERADWKRFDGVILAPGDPSALYRLFKGEESEPPLIFVNSDAPLFKRMASISVDSLVSGSIAAEMLSRTILGPAKVATITGDLRIQDHKDKYRGFASGLAAFANHLSLLAPIESHEDPKEGYEVTRSLIRKNRNLGGLYISTANSVPVLRALDEANLLGKVKIVTTDFFSELVPLIENNQVLCSLHQRPYTQGRTAVELLYAHLMNAPSVAPITRLAPDIVLRSNLQLFVNSLTQK